MAETAVAVDNFEQLSEKIVDGGEIVVSGHISFEDTLRITKDTTIRFTGDNPYLYMDNSYIVMLTGSQAENMFYFRVLL